MAETSAVKLGDLKTTMNNVRAATTAVRLSKRGGSIRQTQAFGGFDLFAEMNNNRNQDTNKTLSDATIECKLWGGGARPPHFLLGVAVT